MNRSEFCRAFAETSSMTIGQGEIVCNQVLDFLANRIEEECIEHGHRIYIKGLGTFKCKEFKERRVGNFNGGDARTIPAKKKVVFDPAQSEVKHTPDYDKITSELLLKIAELPREEMVKRLMYIAHSGVPTPEKYVPSKVVRVAEPRTKICLECGKSFKEIQKTQKYCCVSCREKHYRDERIAFSQYYNQKPNGKNVTINL